MPNIQWRFSNPVESNNIRATFGVNLERLCSRMHGHVFLVGRQGHARRLLVGLSELQQIETCASFRRL